ncbi:MAG: PEP-CTERM sorting domain-containing protein [Bryobacterales bacterium]|nr:PEP-CTERM sorting domain-containing protein [Bryobacterales bacterium]
MKRPLSVLSAALFVSAASSAFAASCGSLASPTACSATIGGNIQFDASVFQLANASGTKVYQAADILIDLSVSGTTAVLTFSKSPNTPTTGTTFFVNSGDTAGMVVSYTAAITPLAAGTVAFTGASVVSPMSTAGNGFASVQFSIPSMATCQVLPSAIDDTAVCTLPSGLGTSTAAGNLVSLSGNTGNAAILRFANVFDTSFTAAPTSGVPEPSSFALIGLGISGLAWFRRRAAH